MNGGADKNYKITDNTCRFEVTCESSPLDICSITELLSTFAIPLHNLNQFIKNFVHQLTKNLINCFWKTKTLCSSLFFVYKILNFDSK